MHHQIVFKRKLLKVDRSTKWENIDSCSKQYRCVTALHLILLLEHAYIIIIERVVGEPGYDMDILMSWMP